MFVDDDICISEIQNTSDSAFGTLIHEYVHYIQHLTTLFGVRICDMYHRISLLYRAYIQEHDVIKLPLHIWEKDKNISIYLEDLQKIAGSKSSDFNIDAADINNANIESAEKNRTAVCIGCYDYENGKIHEQGLRFGYHCVIESMAHEIQKLFVSELHHPKVPYSTAEMILREYYPNALNDNKLIVSICLCALHWNNPGVGFFKVTDIAKDNPDWNGLELYKHIAQDYCVSFKGEEVPRYRLMLHFLNEFKVNLEQLLGTKLNYYKKVLENCCIEARKSTSRLLEAIYDPSLINNKSKLYNCLVDYYGYPLIDANNYTIIPTIKIVGGREKPYLETAVLFGWELILNRVCELNQEKACERLPICSKGIYTDPENCKVSEYCSYAPWKNKGKCPFTQCLEYFGFQEKEFIG